MRLRLLLPLISSSLAPVFKPMRGKPIVPCTRDFSRAFTKLQVIARNSDWFIALFAPSVIGRNNYSDIGFSQEPMSGSMQLPY